MTYTRAYPVWKDQPDLTTPITAGKLQGIEDGIADNDTRVRGLFFNVKDYGAVGDGITDDTAAFVAAIDAAKLVFGVVFVPSGKYKLTSQITVEFCTLLGNGSISTDTSTGSIFHITDVSLPAIKLGYGGMVKGMTFYYPSQVTTGAPTVYPATIQMYHTTGSLTGMSARMSVVENTFINSYVAIDTNGSSPSFNAFPRVERNDICCIFTGVNHPFSTIETCIDNNIFTYAFWNDAQSDMKTTINTTAVGVRLGNGTQAATGTMIRNNTFFGLRSAVAFAGDAALTIISGNMVDGCYRAIDLSGIHGTTGELSITGGTISAGYSGATDGWAIGGIFTGGIAFSQIGVSGVVFAGARGSHIYFDIGAATLLRVALVVTGCTMGTPGYNDTSAPHYGIYINDTTTALTLVASGNVVCDEVNGGLSKAVGVYAKCSAAAIVGNIFKGMDKSVDVSDMPVNSSVTVGGNTAVSTLTQDLYYPAAQGRAAIHNNRWSRSAAGTELSTGSFQVTATTTTTLPDSYDAISVVGNTAITSITASWHGRQVTLVFSGTPTVTDGSNLKLNGNFVATADDTISLVCDGTNWYETGRSAN